MSSYFLAIRWFSQCILVYMQNTYILLILTRNWKFITDYYPRTDKDNWENYMIEKLQFPKHKKSIPEKPFSHVTSWRIPVIPRRFSRSRSQGVLGVLRCPGGRNWSQGYHASRRSLISGTVSNFSTMPDQSNSKKKLKLLLSFHLSEISLNQHYEKVRRSIKKRIPDKKSCPVWFCLIHCSKEALLEYFFIFIFPTPPSPQSFQPSINNIWKKFQTPYYLVLETRK